LILFSLKNLLRFVLTGTIIIYTFLSIFISNNIISPGFYALEILILFIVTHILIIQKSSNQKHPFLYLFFASFIIFMLFNLNYLNKTINDYTSGEKYTLNIGVIKKLKENKYFCPNDLKHVSSQKFIGAVISGTLVKPFYSDISIINRYSNWDNIPARFAVPSSLNNFNPCGID